MSRDMFKELDMERTKLRRSLLETYIKKIENLQDLAKETLSHLQSALISDVESEGEVSGETEKLFNDITDLISTSSSARGTEVLRMARKHLREALYPPYPYDFPQPRRIRERFKTYRDCFEYAVQQHVLKWEQWLMEGTRQSYKGTIGDIQNIYSQLNQSRHSSQKVEKID